MQQVPRIEKRANEWHNSKTDGQTDSHGGGSSLISGDLSRCRHAGRLEWMEKNESLSELLSKKENGKSALLDDDGLNLCKLMYSVYRMEGKLFFFLLWIHCWWWKTGARVREKIQCDYENLIMRRVSWKCSGGWVSGWMEQSVWIFLDCDDSEKWW